MESRLATMTTKVPSAGATPLYRGLPEDIVVWEILVRLPPKSLLRCGAVCRAWRRVTSTRLFLLAHHGRQPTLPIIFDYNCAGAYQKDILAFNHRATSAQLQPIARLKHDFRPEASCDGLLIVCKYGRPQTYFSVCNPATLQHASFRQLSRFRFSAMYLHRPTSEYRLLLNKTIEGKFGRYVYTVGSDQPPRYVGRLELAASTYTVQPVVVRDSLHWFPVHYGSDPQIGSKVVIVFDTIFESFRQMRAPLVPAKSYIFKMDDTLGIHSYNDTTQTVDIWMLQNYESEVWRYKYKYNVKLPATDIRRQFGWLGDNWYVSVHSVNGDVLLLVSCGGWMFCVDVKGKLVKYFRGDGQVVYAFNFQLKQTLVPHTFFTALEDNAPNTSPFI